MAGNKIKLKDQLGRVVRVGGDGTPGATVGRDLRWPDGSIVKLSEIKNPAVDSSTGGMAPTMWKLIREIPANIQKLAKLGGIGFTTRDADGEWYQRSIQQGEGIDVANGDGVAGNPTIGLADVPDAGGGTLQKTLRDEFGRLAGTSAATTDDLDEGAGNLYFTDSRADARAAVAVAAHVAEPDPHTQYTTAAEAAAAAPVQSVNTKTGSVVHSPADIGLAGGMTGQFWRGDGVWSNELLGPIIFRMALGNNEFRQPTPAASVATQSIGGQAFYGGNGASEALGGTFNFRASRLWTPTDNGSDYAIRLIKNGTTTLFEAWRIRGDGAMVPGSDNAQACGDAALRWSTVYTGSGTINTSDAREKTSVCPLTTAEIAAAIELGSEIGVYQWLAMIEQKGDAARQHVGMTVQRAIAVLESHGLDPFAYGFICYDEWLALPEIRHEWPAQSQVVDDFGNLVREAVDAGFEVVQEFRAAGDRYSFRMDELLAFIAKGLSHRLDSVEQRLAAAGL